MSYWNYEYTLKDHLGNARVNFRANGTTITHLEELHYYPFGMLMEGLGTSTPSNDYAYNGKELNEDFGLNLSDYGARWYDAALGRWSAVDPLAEKYTSWSGYNYVMGNPVGLVDPDGMRVTDPLYYTSSQYLADMDQKAQEQHEERKKKEEKNEGFTTYVSISSTAKEKGFDAKDLTKTLNHISEIFEKNGLSNLLNFIIVAEEGVSKLRLYDDDLFLGIIYSPVRRPGNSFISTSGNVAMVDNMGGFVTYANYYHAMEDKTNVGADPLYRLGYLSAHELLHQLNQKAWYQLDRNYATDPILKNDGHNNSCLNLNMEGPIVHQFLPLKANINFLHPAETIIYQQKKMILN